MKSLFSFLALGLVLVTACGFNLVPTRGSGNVVTEARTVSNFHQIDLTGAGEVNITQGDTESLTIETDDNILPLIVTRVDNGLLSIGLDPNRTGLSIAPTRIVFTVAVKNLDSLKVSGAGNIRAQALKSDNLAVTTSGAGNITLGPVQAKTLNLRLSGAGNVTVSGQVESQDAALSGLGNYNAADLSSTNAKVALSGAGSATVWATGTLNAQISGAGSINYYGSPQVSQNISGVGSIKGLGNK
jgi:hypothetical protein